MSAVCFPVRFGLGLVLLGMALGVGGCSSSSDSLGGTPGGAQDEALANEKIDQGMVPNPEDVTVEGMLASEDLPLDGPACEKPLCIQSAYAVAPTLDADRSAVFVQMGFSSGIDEATFRRNPLNVSVVVDRSGSMSGEKMTAVKTALNGLVSQLDEGDRLSIVLFDDRLEVLSPSAPVTNKSELSRLISQIYARGSTNMSLGLKEGFAQVGKFAGQTGVTDRVFVLTDAMVNTGSTDTASFVNQASSAAEQGIGLTVFGIGIDLNQELVLAISQLRGGNYAYLSDAARIASVFDQDFDFLVTPLAYDLRFTLTPASGFRVNAVYGFPAWATGMSQVDIRVATVFLSRGHGAIVARLEPIADWPSGPAPLSKLELSYQPADATESQSETHETLYAGNEPLEDTSQLYEQIGVRRTVAYVNAALGMKQACSLYWENRHLEAIALLDRTEALLTSEADATEDANLTTAALRVSHLRSNMQNPAYEDSYYEEGNDVVGPFACHLGPRGVAAPGGAPPFFVLMLSIGLARLRRFPDRSSKSNARRRTMS